MSIIKYVFLGIVQGLTEFLPVSSSAHLLVFRDLLQIQENRILLEIVLHLGTLLALIVFLFKDIQRLLNKRILALIFLVTALTTMVVVLGKNLFEGMFFSTKGLILPLFITGLVLLYTKRFTHKPLRSRPAESTQGKRSFADLKVTDALWLGIVQGLAVIPGLSRSGVTISTLLFRNVEKETAFKFSFLASILAILGALFFKLGDFSQLSLFEFRYMFFGFFASFLSGLIALKILLAVVRRARLHLFGYYCLLLAFLLLIFHIVI